MKIEDIFAQDEGKTLEFKENAQSLSGIIKTIIAFANTAGGTIVLGIQDKTKKIVGLQNPLHEEERLTSAIADSIVPLLVPDIEIQTYRDRAIILIHIPHMAGPYYLKDAGHEKGVYIRLGSTNRIADAPMLESLKLFSKNRSYDELPYLHEDGKLDRKAINDIFATVNKKITETKAENLGLITKHSGKSFPSQGSIILFGVNRTKIFPNAIIRCARFLGTTKAKILDHTDIESYPIKALEEALRFIQRNTAMRAEIGSLYRTDISEYPSIAVREAIINAILHADYTIKGSSIMIAIFDDRMEISNPGGLIFGQTLQKALSGSSVIRNYVIAHTFRELKIIEQWGSGLQRIIEACTQRGLEVPLFEERSTEFKVTLFSIPTRAATLEPSQKEFIATLKKKKKISTKEAAQFWGISSRNALTRLKRLVDLGLIKKIGTSTNDPQGSYISTEAKR